MRSRAMPATRCNDRIMPVTTRDASNNERSQQLCAVPIHDRGKNAQCHQQRAMPSTTHDRSNNVPYQQHNKRRQRQRTMPAIADDATDNKRRWHNGPSQQQRPMPAITNDRSNNTPCQQPRAMTATRHDDRIMPVTTRDASDCDLRQLPLAMPAITHDASNCAHIDTRSQQSNTMPPTPGE